MKRKGKKLKEGKIKKNIRQILLYGVIVFFILFMNACDFLNPGLGDTVDLSNPSVGITSHINGDYAGGIIILSGDTQDDIQVASVIITSEAEEITASIDGENWTATVDTNTLNDGDNEFTVTATDTSGKTASVTLLLIVDNNPSTVLVTTPDSYGPEEEFNKTIAIKGEATDSTRVREVLISLYTSSGTAVFTDEKATGTSSWYYTFDSSEMADGVYYFNIKAVDNSGNSNSWFYHFDDVYDLAYDPGNLPNIEEIHSADFEGEPISSGVLSDSLSSIRLNLESSSRMEMEINSNSDKPEFTFVSPAYPDDINTALDDDPASYPLGGTQRFSGFVSDDDGVDYDTLQIAIWTYVDATTSYQSLTPVMDWTTIPDASTQWTYNTTLPDNSYVFKMSVDDIYGTNQTVGPLPFKVQSSTPIFKISSPSQGILIGPDSFISFDVYVTYMGSGDVRVDVDEDGIYEIVLTAPGADTLIGTWSGEITATTDFAVIDGEHSFIVRAGTEENNTTQTFYYTGDTGAPSVSIDAPSADETVNGNYTISGSTGDTNTVSSITLVIDGTAINNDVLSGTKYNWNYDLDSTQLSLGSHLVTITAIDGAGNENATSQSFIVDQTTDRPEISFIGIDKDETLAANNILVGASTITGYIEDDDSVDPESIYVEIDNSGTWEQATPSTTTPGKMIMWEFDISLLAEGEHSIKVRAADTLLADASETMGDSSDLLTSTENFHWTIEDSDGSSGIPFIINFGAPSISIQEPVEFSYHNTDVPIKVLVSDNNGIASVEFSYDNGISWENFTLDGVTANLWNYTFTIADKDDNTYTYLIRAKDSYDSASLESSQFTVDATPPESFINIPSESQTVNGNLTFSGTASDNINLSKVYYNIQLASITDLPIFPDDYTQFAGNYTWNSALDTTAETDATYTLRVKSVDSAGNSSLNDAGDDDVSVNFIINQESDRPEISFSSITEGGDFIANVLPASKQMTGSVVDDDSVDMTTMQYRIYENEGNETVDWTDDTAVALITPYIDWTNLYTEADNKADSTLATWSCTFSTLTDGQYHVQLRAADINDAGSWTVDGYGWEITPLVEMSVDTAYPDIDITTPLSNGGYTNQDLTVNGTFYDAGGIESADIQFGSGTVTTLSLTDLGGNTYSWGYTNLIDTDTHYDDGVLTYTVTATDSYGKQSTAERYITVDTVNPYIDSLELVNNDQTGGNVVNGSVQIQGTPSDAATLVNAIYYRNATSVPDEPTNPVTDTDTDGTTLLWTPLTSTTNISYRFDSTALNNTTSDVVYTSYLLVEDLAGNRTAVGDYTVPFTINQTGNYPVVTFNTTDSSLLYSTDSISGTITDDDGVDVSTIQISFDDGSTWTPVSNKPSTNSTSVSFSHILTSIDERLASYPVRVRASDEGEDFDGFEQDISAVESISTPLTIKVDNATPTASITNINNGQTDAATIQGVYINQEFTITGTASDDVQVAAVRAKLDIDSGIPTSVINTGTNFSTWTYSRDTLSITDDSVGLIIEVDDYHGRTTTYNYTLLVDSQKPTVTITQDTGGDPETYYGSDVDFSGIASDNMRIDKVYYAHQATTAPDAPVNGDPETDTNYTLLVDQTISWSTSLDTLAIQDALGIADADKDADLGYYLSIVAVDGAGNLSDKTDLYFIINQGGDRPTYSFTNVTAGTTDTIAKGNLLESNAKIWGSADDAEGLASILIATSEDNVTFGSWADITTDGSNAFAVSGVSQNWQSYVADLGEGVHYAKFLIQDNNFTDSTNTPFNQTETAVVAFTVDTAAPTVSLDSFDIDNPYVTDGIITRAASTGMLIHNSFTVNGIVTDGNTVTSIIITFPNPANPDADLSEEIITVDNPWDDIVANGNAWSYSIAFDRDGSYDGTMPITITATDQFDKSTTASLSVIIDTLEPVITPTQPSGITETDPPDVNGIVTLRGTITEVNGIASFSAIGGISNDVPLTNSGSDLSWILSFDSDSYASSFYGTEKTVTRTDTLGIDYDATLYNFPIDFEVFDNADNRTYETFSIDIDPDSDKPLLYLTSPGDESSVAGAFMVYGTATDDDDISTIELQVDFNDDGIYTDTDLDLDSSGTAGDAEFENEATPVSVAVTNGSWAQQMNQSNELALATLQGAGITDADGWIRILATPVDTSGTYGNSTEIRVYVDSTAPVISGQGVTNPTPASGSIVNGTVTIAARFEDDKVLTTSKMQVSYDGGVSYSAIDSSDIGDNGLVGSYYQYDIDIDVDTTSAVTDGNGILSIVLKVTDETYKQSTYSMTLNVDNTLPTGVWNYNSALTSISDLYTFSGNDPDTDDCMLIGSVKDTGTISGVARVEVYFVKNGNFISPVTQNDTLSTTGYSANIADMSGTEVGIPFIQTPIEDDYATTAEYESALALFNNYVISIDNRYERGIYDDDAEYGDNDGFQESLKSKGDYDEWYVYIDSTILPDGPLDLYYLVYDTAGNVSYELASAQMSNYPPGITDVTVNSTPLSGDDNVMKVGGQFTTTINVSDTSPGTVDPADIKLSVLAKYSNSSGSPNLDDEDTDFNSFHWGSDTDATSDFDSDDGVGSTTYAAETIDFNGTIDSATATSITDDALIGASVETGMNLILAGGTVTVTGFNSATGTVSWTGDLTVPTGSYVISYFVSGAWYLFEAEVTDSDGNIVTYDFYLWVSNDDSINPEVYFDDNEDWITVSDGHHDPVGTTINTDDPNVSGEIILSGTAYDDTSVSDILISINGATAVSVTAQNSDNLNQISGSTTSGYTYSWTYTWDTSSLPGSLSAANNVTIDVTAVDGSSNTTATPATKTVDVVPYITDITTGFDSGLKTYIKRSALGKYTVPVGKILYILGYNLSTDNGSVTINDGTNSDTLNPQTGSSTTSLEIDTTGLDHSGAITVTNNSIDSTNNNNDNSLSTNQEATLYAPDQKDDRWISLWEVTSTDLEGTEAVMRTNSLNTMDWMYVKNNVDIYMNDDKMTESFSIAGGDFEYNNDGTRLWSFVNDTQWGVEYDDARVYGSVQWSKENGYDFDNATTGTTVNYYEAYNFNITSKGRLGLGNLYDGTIGVIGRYENVQMELNGDDTDTDNFITYYDSYSDELIFVPFEAGTNTDGTDPTFDSDFGTATLTNYSLDGSWYSTIEKNAERDTFFKTTGNESQKTNGLYDPVYGLDTGDSSAMITVLSSMTSGFDYVLEYDKIEDILYLAYYDPSGPSLKLLRNTDPLTTPAAGDWEAYSATISTDGGSHLDMKVDPSGGIHISYLNIDDGFLNYAYISDFDTDTTPEIYTVDALLSSGQYTSLSLRNFGSDYRPVISYYSTAFSGSTAAIRMAYPTVSVASLSAISAETGGGNGADSSSGEFTGTWEVITVPAETNPQAVNQFMELNGSNNAVVGYNGTYMEEAEYLDF